MKKMELLDYLAYKEHCNYISDLRSVMPHRLYMDILRIGPDECSEQEWQAAVNYLTEIRDTSAMSSVEARDQLLHAMSSGFKQPFGHLREPASAVQNKKTHTGWHFRRSKAKCVKRIVSEEEKIFAGLHELYIEHQFGITDANDTDAMI